MALLKGSIQVPATALSGGVCLAVPGPCTPLAGLDIHREGMDSFHAAVGHKAVVLTLRNLEGGLT